MAPTPIDLALGEDGEEHPHRLLLIGNQLVAYGGDQGNLSVVKKNDKAQVVRRFDDAVRAVAVSHNGKRVAVGFDDGSTQIYRYDKVDEEHPFLRQSDSTDDDDFLSQSDGFSDPNQEETMFPGPRFDVPVRHMQFDPRSNHLCIASEAGVCIVDVTSPESLKKERLLQQEADRYHDASGIRGVCYLPHNDGDNKMFLATLAMDGRLCVWDVTGDDPSLDWELHHRDGSKCVPKSDIGEIHGADVYDRSCLPVAVGDTCLVLPGMTDVNVRLLKAVETQHFLPSLPDQGHTDSIVAMASSPDGRHLVTSGRDGRVILWSINTEDESCGEFVCQLGQYESIPTHMVWNETDRQQVLSMACANGTLLNIEGRDKIVPNETSANNNKMAQANHNDNNTNMGKEQEDPPQLASAPGRKRIVKSQVDNTDSEDDVDFGDEKAATSSATKKAVSFVADEAEEDNDEEDEPSAREKEQENDVVSAREDHNDDLVDDDDFDFHRTTPLTPISPLPDPQPPFAPSATPLDQARRIMCWNQIGTITYLRDDDGMTRNTVDIDFSDSATRRPVSFTDNMNFILGSIGEDGAIFASDLTDDDHDDADEFDGLNISKRTKDLVRRSQSKRDGMKSTGSNVYFHRFETFGLLRDKDWLLTLPDGERAVGCACGEGWAAVITSRRFLRLFSSGGNQYQIIWLEGEPVTIVGRGRFVAVFYHEGNPLLDGTQKLGYALFDASSNSTIASGSLSAISSASQLQWAGFSNECSLVVMDSDGMVSMLVGTTLNEEAGTYSWEWSPMLDTVGLRKSADDKFWPIGIQDGKLICVPLKGGNDYPDAARRPVTTTLPFRMPFARCALEKSSGLEELSVRANLALTQKKILNGFVAVSPEDRDELEDEYTILCAQVDKVTLKLFMTTVNAGKLERALDLVDRLHLEKSFHIAMTVADRLNHRNLSDRIVEKKDLKFMVDEPFDHVEDAFPPTYNEEPVGDDVYEEDEAVPGRRISPDFHYGKSKRSQEDAFGDEETDQRNCSEKEPCGATRSLAKPINPFAKKRMESPSKPSISPIKSPSKVALSRSSTFSTQSRKKSKISKLIL